MGLEQNNLRIIAKEFPSMKALPGFPFPKKQLFQRMQN
jgi:hypothetical protein